MVDERQLQEPCVKSADVSLESRLAAIIIQLLSTSQLVVAVDHQLGVGIRLTDGVADIFVEGDVARSRTRTALQQRSHNVRLVGVGEDFDHMNVEAPDSIDLLSVLLGETTSLMVNPPNMIARFLTRRLYVSHNNGRYQQPHTLNTRILNMFSLSPPTSHDWFSLAVRRFRILLNCHNIS